MKQMKKKNNVVFFNAVTFTQNKLNDEIFSYGKKERESRRENINMSFSDSVDFPCFCYLSGIPASGIKAKSKEERGKKRILFGNKVMIEGCFQGVQMSYDFIHGRDKK